MDKSLELIERLTEKIHRLVEVHQALVAENLALQDAVNVLRNERDELSELLHFERQTKQTQTEQSENSVSNLEVEAIKQKLDVLIGETELCIKQLKEEF